MAPAAEKIKPYLFHLSMIAVIFGLVVVMTWNIGKPIGWGVDRLKAFLVFRQAEDAGLGDLDPKRSELYHVLKNASMADGTVILTTLTEAWAQPGSLFDLFREAFSVGIGTEPLLKHLVVIAVDEKALERCRSLHPHCYLFTIDGVDLSGSEKKFMTMEYMTLMWERTRLYAMVLELGYNFIQSDLDIIWFRTPLPYFSPAYDFTFACDYYIGEASNLGNTINGGYYYARSNKKTITLYKYWYEARNKYPGRHDQDVFNIIKTSPFVMDMRVDMRFLDTGMFGGFCQHGDDLAKMCTIHANCCTGLQHKLNNLSKILAIWKNYTSLPEEKRSTARAHWEGPNCG